jgi:hypothetical protein
MPVHKNQNIPIDRRRNAQAFQALLDLKIGTFVCFQSFYILTLLERAVLAHLGEQAGRENAALKRTDRRAIASGYIQP